MSEFETIQTPLRIYCLKLYGIMRQCLWQ